MTERTFPVPALVTRLAGDRPDLAALVAGGYTDAVRLQQLSQCFWPLGRTWARSVLRGDCADDRAMRVAMVAAGVHASDGYSYFGLLDPEHEVEVVMAALRASGNELSYWDTSGWTQASRDPDGLKYVELDRDNLAFVIDALSRGSSGVVLRPTSPRTYLPSRTEPLDPIDVLVAAAVAAPHPGAMVALYPDPATARKIRVADGEPPEAIHLTLAYLGEAADLTPDQLATLDKVVAAHAAAHGALEGEIAGTGQFKDTGDGPPYVALADIPDLPEWRQDLVVALANAGLPVATDHGFTPHMTLAFAPGDELESHDDPAGVPLTFGEVCTRIGGNHTAYPLGTGVLTASVGVQGPPGKVYAVVDEFDTSAVLDLCSVVAGPRAFVRRAGAWVEDKDLLARLRGVDPPPIVSVDDAVLASAVDQVDAYDRAHPSTEKSVTAAGFGPPRRWDESKYKRAAGGKFGAKSTGEKVKRAELPRVAGQHMGHPGPGSSAPGPGAGAGPGGPSGGQNGPPMAPPGTPPPHRAHADRTPTNPETIRNQPWRMLDHNGHLAGGVGPEFWKTAPAGFQDWLVQFLRDQKPKQSKPTTPQTAKEKAAAKKAAAKAKKTGKTKSSSTESGWDQWNKDHPNAPAYFSQIPPKYQAAMARYLEAVVKAGHDPKRGARIEKQATAADKKQAPSGGGPAARRAKAQGRDLGFDVRAEKERVGENKKRYAFDKQVAASYDQMKDMDPNEREGLVKQLREKVAAERRRRIEVDKIRHDRVEAEKVRRLAARRRETNTSAKELAITADASLMPSKLKKYWVTGEGALKIRWGTGGDFNRCRKALAKYLKPGQLSGACANLHNLATGHYPGPGKGT